MSERDETTKANEPERLDESKVELPADDAEDDEPDFELHGQFFNRPS
jgi:hypothetical protein